MTLVARVVWGRPSAAACMHDARTAQHTPCRAVPAPAPFNSAADSSPSATRSRAGGKHEERCMRCQAGDFFAVTPPMPRSPAWSR